MAQSELTMALFCETAELARRLHFQRFYKRQALATVLKHGKCRLQALVHLVFFGLLFVYFYLVLPFCLQNWTNNMDDNYKCYPNPTLKRSWSYKGAVAWNNIEENGKF